MYVISGYFRGEKRWYNLKNNKWVETLLQAEFFNTHQEAQLAIYNFQ